MKNLPISAVIMLLLFGCSTTHVVEQAEAPMWGPDAVYRLSGKNVDVVLRSGSLYQGEILKVDAEKIIQRNRDPGADTAIPMDSVVRIEGPSNALLVPLGIVGGALVGGLVGYAIGLASDPMEGDPTGITIVSNSAAAGAVGLLVGGVLGGVIVGVATATDDYSVAHSLRLPRRSETFKRGEDTTAVWSR